MKLSRLFGKVIRRPVEICACGAAMLALLSWLSWLSNDWRIAAFGSDYVPTAPATAWSMILLGSAVFAHNVRPAAMAARRFAFFTIFGVGAISLLLGLQYLFGFELPMERWLAPAARQVGNFRSGRMSPLSAAAFLGAASAFCLELPPLGRRWICRQAAALSALAVALTGLFVVFSYTAGAPLLYGSHTIPMALPTAISFLLLGTSIMSAAGFDAVPLSIFGSGSSATSPSHSHGSLYTIVSTFFFLSTAFGIIGYQYFKHQVAASRQAAQCELSAIADLKVRQIVNWRQERLGDAENIKNELFFGKRPENSLPIRTTAIFAPPWLNGSSPRGKTINTCGLCSWIGK